MKRPGFPHGGRASKFRRSKRLACGGFSRGQAGQRVPLGVHWMPPCSARAQCRYRITGHRRWNTVKGSRLNEGDNLEGNACAAWPHRRAVAGVCRLRRGRIGEADAGLLRPGLAQRAAAERHRSAHPGGRLRVRDGSHLRRDGADAGGPAARRHEYHHGDLAAQPAGGL